MVVAHPDDEVLWAGGLPLRYPGDWTIICCSTPVNEPERAAQFPEVCAVLGAKALMYPEKDISKKILLKELERVNLDSFDHIVTHGPWGEYGHPHHKQVHDYVVSKYKHKRITTFGCRPCGINVLGYKLSFGQRMYAMGVHKIYPTPAELERKMTALRKYAGLVKRDKIYIPVWQDVIDLDCTRRGLNFVVETYDGDWPIG